MTLSQEAEIYLGDGLYARFDQFGMLILRTPRDGGDHWVALEPEVLEALRTYVDSVVGPKHG